jgi:hypothetical protein
LTGSIAPFEYAIPSLSHASPRGRLHVIGDKVPQATGKQAIDLQAAILAALRKRNGEAVIGEGAPARGCLKDGVN